MKIELDVDELIKKAEAWGAAADQMPYALSRALNATMDDARDYLVTHTWPEHVTVRNSNFIRRALTILYSDKHDLQAMIYENRDNVRSNAHLALHDKGGTKTAKGQFTIPTGNITLTSFGPRADEKPGHFKGVILGRTLYKRVKHGRGRHHTSTLVPMYRLARSVNQPADVPFTEDFQRIVRTKIDEYFLPYMTQAMATRRR